MIPVISALLFVSSTGTPAGVSSACPPMEEVTEVSGERGFRQVRKLEGVDQHLVSSGTVDVGEDRVVWTVTDPLTVSTIISEDGITQSIAGGPAEPVETGGGMNPMLTTGLFDVLGGNLEGAGTYFSIEQLPSDDGKWRVRLVPKDEQAADYMASMTVTGCSSINEIRVDQTNGDEMTVTFEDG